jgi:glycolate oxidase FAD binding subunit
MTHLEPADVAALASMLSSANAERLAVLPRGGGTKLAWGRDAAPVDAVLSTARLDSPIDHAAGDLVATLPAGARLGDVNAALARQGQWLPLDPPFAARATIGGIVATNDSGPRRHRFGTPRDLVIGVHMVLADGRAVKAGGRVVKNVAGYDLGRLLCGSFGTLAVVTSATFKLAPLAPASRTVVVEVPGPRAMDHLIEALTAALVTPSAIEIDAGSDRPARLLIRFESTEKSAAHQARATSELCERLGGSVRTIADAVEADAWRECQTSVWESPGTLVKIAVLPSDLIDTLERLDRRCREQAAVYRVTGRAALGILLARLGGNPEAHPALVEGLRRSAGERGGSVVVVDSRLPAGAIDRWGEIGDALPLMRSLKARFDPNGILSPGRGPGGL